MMARGFGAAVRCTVAIICAFAAPAWAKALEVYSPHVEWGEAEIETAFFRTFDGDATRDDARVEKVSLGYGINEFWFAEVYGIWERAAGPAQQPRFEASEWENRFQMAQPGEAWADLGLLAEYERSRGGGPDEIAFGPLLEKDIGASTENLNVIVEHQIGRHDEHGFNLTYRAQARWRLYETFEPALQMFGEFGAVGDMPAFAAQEHAIGPAVLGRWRLGTLPGRIGYDIGYLFGVTKDTTDGALKAIVEYEFQF